MGNSNQVTNSDPIDFEQLSSLLGCNDKLEMIKYLKLFLDIFPGLIAEIKAAVANQDVRATHHAAHKAKGAANSAAAPNLVRILRELETNAMSEEWDSFHNLVTRIESEYARVELLCADSQE